MIQIRKANGEAQPVTGEGNFVELVNDMDGTVMMVFVQIAPGTILKILPGSRDAIRYQRMFADQGVTFASSLIER